MREITSPIEFDEYLIGKGIDFQTELNFCVPGKPMGKERPRNRRIGKISITYTPKKTLDYEDKVKNAYLNSVGNIKLNGAIEGIVVGVFEPPKSVSKKERQRLLEQENYLKKPDCDNIEKIIYDALNNVAFNDDSHVCDSRTKKIYGEESMVRINLKEIRKED